MAETNEKLPTPEECGMDLTDEASDEEAYFEAYLKTHRDAFTEEFKKRIWIDAGNDADDTDEVAELDDEDFLSLFVTAYYLSDCDTPQEYVRNLE